MKECCDQPDCLHPIADQIGEEVRALIRWAADTSPRSLQAVPGPSELGDPCDRRLAYRLAGSPTFNKRPDPLAAVIGTGLHTWLEQAVLRFNREFGDSTLIPETHLEIDPIVRGTSDLYHRDLRCVIDYKGAGADVIKKAMADGPTEGYKIQTHLYGYGYEQAGLPVDLVALVYIPRAGTLKTIHVWVDRYNPALAESALKRMYDVGDKLISLGDSPSRFDKITAAPESKRCWYCPFWGEDMLTGATEEYGCPGR